jgi:hypothetical protein
MKVGLIATVCAISLVVVSIPVVSDVRDRAAWANETFQKQCKAYNMDNTIVRLRSGAGWWTNTEVCSDDTGYIRKKISGWCHIPNLTVFDTRSNETTTFVHPDCK